MPKVRCQYNEERMKKAIKAVQLGMSGRSASIQFNVPRTTLRNKVSGKSPEITKLGRNTVLSVKEEKMIVDWILKCRSRGMPPSNEDILNSVQDMISADKSRKTPFNQNRPGKSWLNLFMNRHPALNQEYIESSPDSHDSSTDKETSFLSKSIKTEQQVKNWFQQLKKELETMGALDILKDPSRVFSSDESNIELCPKTGRVIGPKAWQNVYEIPPGQDKSTISFLRTFCANGDIVCPAVFYPFVRVPSNIANCVPESFYIGSSKSGWIKTETFLDFLAKGFIEWLKSHHVPRPVILFVNGKTTHITVQLSNFCEENEIILYLLPRNHLHVLQPALTGDIEPFATSWNTAVLDFQRENPTSLVRCVNVAPLLGNILKKVHRNVIINSFALSGLCPLDAEKVRYSKITRSFPTKGMEDEEEEDPYPMPLTVSQDSRYANAKSVLLEFLPKKELELLKNNKGDNGLQEFWCFIHSKIQEEHKVEDVSQSVSSPVKYEVKIPAEGIKKPIVISLESNSTSSNQESSSSLSIPQEISYVILNS